MRVKFISNYSQGLLFQGSHLTVPFSSLPIENIYLKKASQEQIYVEAPRKKINRNPFCRPVPRHFHFWGPYSLPTHPDEET